MAATTETKIWLALRSHLEAMVLSPALEIAWPDETFEPVTNTPYIEVIHLPNSTQRQFLKSSDPYYYQGILNIVVHGKINLLHGYTQILEVAGQIAAYFSPDRRLKYNDVTVKVKKHPDILKGERDGAFFNIPVSIQYHLET